MEEVNRMTNNRKLLGEKAKSLAPLIRIGKNGLTDSMVLEIKKNLKKRKLVKIKLLKACLENSDRKALARQIAEKTNSELIDAVGFAVVIWKR